MIKANIKQVQAQTPKSLASSVASKQKEASQLTKQSNTFQSMSTTLTQTAVKQLSYDAERKALEDSTNGELDMNSTQSTVYGQAYAKKANQISQTKFNTNLEDAQSKAISDNEYDLEGYNAQMEEFYSSQNQETSDDQLAYRKQSYSASFMRGQRAIVKNSTEKINSEYLASLQTSTVDSRKNILQHADSGDNKAYKTAQDAYVADVTTMLSEGLIEPSKAVAMIKTQYDEGTREFILSDFDKMLDKSIDGAIDYAKGFKTAKDTDEYPDGDRLYDVEQRDEMYAQMTAKIKVKTDTKQTAKNTAIKKNSDIVKDAIEGLKNGSNAYELQEALTFSEDELSAGLYDELRAEQTLLPERVAFKQMPNSQQQATVKAMENEQRAGEKMTVEETRLLQGMKSEANKKKGKIQTDPASVRLESYSGDMIKYNGTNMTEYLMQHQDSVNSFFNVEGGKKFYFTEADAQVITDQYNELDSNGKIDLIDSIQNTLGDDAKYVLEQLGQNSSQISTLAQTTELDPTRKTSVAILDGTELLKADKTLIPKEANGYYNALDKSSISESSNKDRIQLKKDVMALAVANNGGGDADMIKSDAIKTAYEQIVGAQGTDTLFGFSTGRTITVPWKGASYTDFEYGVEAITIDDLPTFPRQTKESVLNMIEADNDRLVYKDAGVGKYTLFYDGNAIMQNDGEPVERVNPNGQTVMYQATKPYTLTIRKP